MTRPALRLPAALLTARLALAWRAPKAGPAWQVSGPFHPEAGSR